jgi:hypothetical protein
VSAIQNTKEYQAIYNEYFGRKAERSKVPLINHIHEGLVVMQLRGATEDAQRAFCIHPLLQTDKALGVTLGKLWRVSSKTSVVALAMEYRWRANNWLSDKVINDQGKITLVDEPTAGDFTEVKEMLIADKVQNYKDFLMYHVDTHPRRRELDLYFRTWHKHLGLSETMVTKYLTTLYKARGK